MKYAILTLCLSSILCLSFTACGGGGSKASTSAINETRTTTTGQELLDLQKAYNSGVITERQYNDQKKKILEGK